MPCGGCDDEAAGDNDAGDNPDGGSGGKDEAGCKSTSSFVISKHSGGDPKDSKVAESVPNPDPWWWSSFGSGGDGNDLDVGDDDAEDDHGCGGKD